MSKCCVVNCSNAGKLGIVMFDFPSEAETKEKWLSFLDQSCVISEHSNQLCEGHFTDDQFEIRDEKKILKENAIPTKFNVKLKAALISKPISLQLNKIVPLPKRAKLFQDLHPYKSWPHPDLVTTLVKLNQYHWPDKTKDIERWVNHCKMCQHFYKYRSMPSDSIPLNTELKNTNTQSENSNTISENNNTRTKTENNNVESKNNGKSVLIHIKQNCTSTENKNNNTVPKENFVDLTLPESPMNEKCSNFNNIRELHDHDYCKTAQLSTVTSSNSDVLSLVNLKTESTSLLQQIYTRNQKPALELSKLPNSHQNENYDNVKIRKTLDLPSPALIKAIIPDVESMKFLHLYGLETVVNSFKKTNSINSTMHILPFKCSRCKKDYSPSWSRTNRQIICYSCSKVFYKKNLKYRNIYQASRVTKTLVSKNKINQPPIRPLIHNTSRFNNNHRIKLAESKLIEPNPKNGFLGKEKNPSNLNADQIKEFKVSVQTRIDQLKKDIKQINMPASTSTWVLKQSANEIATAKAAIQNSGICKLDLFKQQQKVQSMKRKFPSSFELLQSITRGKAYVSKKEKQKRK